MRVLVMGGSAFNGRALVPVLVEHGHDVTLCNRGRTVVQHPPGVETLVADRTDPAGMRSVLGGTEWDCVLDMTAYHPEDVELMVEIFDGAVGHYVYVSSCVIYATVSAEHPGPITEAHPVDTGPDQFEYGIDKLRAEDVLVRAHAANGFPGTTVPLGMSFGPHNALPTREQRMFERMTTGRPILMPGDGSATTVVGHVHDQALAFEALMGKEGSFGRRLNLTGDDAHSNRRYIDAFAAVVGVEPEVVEVPASLMDRLWDGEITLSPMGGTGASMDIRPTAAARDRVMPHLHKMPVASLTQRLQPSLHRWDADVVFSVDAMKHVTGWQPAHDFESLVADTHAWWRDADRAHVEHDFTFEDEILEHVRAGG